MWKLTIFFGLLLVALGVGGYIAAVDAGQRSWTALIPAIFFGAPLILAGAIAAKEAARKHAMHAAAMVGLLGVLGGFGMSVPKLLSGEELERPLAVYSSLTLGLICLVFIVLCINSFIQARKNKAYPG